MDIKNKYSNAEKIFKLLIFTCKHEERKKSRHNGIDWSGKINKSGKLMFIYILIIGKNIIDAWYFCHDFYTLILPDSSLYHDVVSYA